ncbi:hypothetical protein MJO28_005405 [Puccinia striiformis f. sp. tritici]|uniref:Uncharacterized protein n=1 Tax=Puccinia striiformis f. sp. tritici TaxID=168172 RepID=A0ACC0EL46_9BASI|nr:hypothetical protein MJO28_005405 [Puccinia striiformis f. sp. tritici]KAI7960387.1 hypothetical protein MJO29_005455 [Puccinia striiformis f. sp. tritici]
MYRGEFLFPPIWPIHSESMQAIHPSLCPILYVQDNEQPTPETTRTTTDVKTRNTIIEVKTSSGPYEMGKAMLEIVVQTRVSDSQYILPKLEKGYALPKK